MGHHGIVEGEKRTPLRRAVRQRQKHIGDKPGFFLNREDLGADIFRQPRDIGDGKAADRWLGHREVSITCDLHHAPFGVNATTLATQDR